MNLKTGNKFMDNNPVNPSHSGDKEYQFPDEEGVRKYESPDAAFASRVNRGDNQGSNRKKLILIISGVIIGALCLYKLYGLFTVAPSKTPLAPTPTAQMRAVPIVPSAQKPEQINPPQTPIISEEKFDKEGFKDKVSTLEKAIEQNSQIQENLQNQISGISSAITEVQDNIAMLTQQINTLVQQKRAAESKLQGKAEAASKPVAVEKTVKKWSARRKNKRRINDGEYYVRAMIQGRAWMVDPNGTVLTISTGDQLPGYGQIQEINADKGMIMTSSGRMINYMPQDR
jgi:intracellular multiplication protein IcmG